MYSVIRYKTLQLRQQSSLPLLGEMVSLVVRSIQTACPSQRPQVHAEEARQAKRELRRRRRSVNRQLKRFSDDSAWYYTEYLQSKRIRVDQDPSKKQEDNKYSTDNNNQYSDDDEETGRMWRWLIKRCTSCNEKNRVQRAWDMWNKININGRNNNDARGEYCHADRKKAHPHDSTFHHHFGSTWQYDFETSWSYNGPHTDNDTKNFDSERLRQKQAGNVHPNFSKPTPMLSHQVRASLALLGLESNTIPTFVELKAAFRKSALLYHPDRFVHHCDGGAAASHAELKFKEVQAAFQLIQPLVAVAR